MHGDLIEQGNHLFQRRSLLAVLLVLPVAFALIDVRQQSGAASTSWLEAQSMWLLLAVVLAGLGQTLRVLTLASVHPESSGRDTRRPRAPVLNVEGMYSLVRHPLYLANLLIILGIVSVFGSPLLILVSGLIFFLVFERVMLIEERFLEAKFGDEFRGWAARTPTLWPRLRNFQRSSLSFDLKTALVREHRALALITLSLVVGRGLVAVVGGGLALDEWLAREVPLLLALASSVGLFLVMRMRRKLAQRRLKQR
jgi:protein-S-isoprenylcysteine O-methyltransferase Ste14